VLALLEGCCTSKAKALARTQALEREMQALQDAQTKGAVANKGTADYEAQLADMAQKLSACQVNP